MIVTCSACGQALSIPDDCYNYYLDCGMQHADCPPPLTKEPCD
jgi:hypothetical protein